MIGVSSRRPTPLVARRKKSVLTSTEAERKRVPAREAYPPNELVPSDNRSLRLRRVLFLFVGAAPRPCSKNGEVAKLRGLRRTNLFHLVREPVKTIITLRDDLLNRTAAVPRARRRDHVFAFERAALTCRRSETLDETTCAQAGARNPRGRMAALLRPKERQSGVQSAGVFVVISAAFYQRYGPVRHPGGRRKSASSPLGLTQSVTGRPF
jgi:hypothetical protein